MNALLQIQVKVIATQAQQALRQIASALRQLNSAGAPKGLQNSLSVTNRQLSQINQNVQTFTGNMQWSKYTQQANAFNQKLSQINRNLSGMNKTTPIWQQGTGATSSLSQRPGLGSGWGSGGASGMVGANTISALTALGRLSQKVNGSMTSTRLGMIQMGKDMQWVGRQINFNFTLPLILAGRQAMTFAMDTEAAFTRVVKVYGTSGNDYTVELGKIKEAMRLLSDVYGVAQEDVMSLAASWAAAGAQGADLAKSVETSLKLSILGDYQDLQKTFEDLIVIQGAYKLNSEQLATAITLLNTVDNETAVQLQDLVTGIAKAGGAANVAGIDIQHLAAMMAVLTPATGSAATAGNMLKTTISRLMAPTNEAKDVLDELDISFESMSYQMLNGTQRLELLAQKFGDLSESQKAMVATVIGSRFQFNKLVVLLDDMNERLGTYQTVLDSLDPTNLKYNFDQADREIKTLLASDPKKLEILTTMIKNLMIDAIIPLVPVLTGALAAIRGLMQWFGNLSPWVQKLAVGFLGLVIAIGVFAQMFGSMQLLLGTFLRFAIKLLTLIPGIGLEASVMSGQVGAQTTAITGAITAQTQSITAALAAAAASQTSTAAEAAAAQTGIVQAAAAAQTAAAGGAAAATTAMPIAAIAAIAVVVAIGIALIVKFHNQIGKWIGGAIDKIKKGFNSLPESVQKALLALLRVVSNIIKSIIHWLSYLNPFQRHSPSLVDNVTAGVQAILDQYARLSGIGDIFAQAAADLQKFADATAAVTAAAEAADRAKQRASVGAGSPGALPALDALYGDLDALNAALAPVSQAIADQQVIVDNAKRAYEEAAAGVEAFEAGMQPLKDKVDQLAKAMDAAQAKIDKFAHMAITGMRAADDAIFENEMAQKSLRLELLRLGAAGESYDSIRDRIAKLNGEIEGLQAKMTSLREGGAGSDILSVYSDQIDALEAQKSGLVDVAQQGGVLEDQLKSLQDQADAMDLEKSLKFDPLLRQIDALVNGTQEMSFDEIIQGITSSRAELDALTGSYNSANAELAAQQAILDEMIANRDKLKDAYDIESDKLKILQDQYDEIAAKIKAIEDAINAVVAANDTLTKADPGGGGGGGGAFDAAAAGDYAPTTLADYGSSLNLDELLKQWQDESAKLFKFDPFGFLRKAWTKVSDWWSGTVAPWFDGIGAWITEHFAPFKGVADGVSKDLGPILEMVTHVFNAIADLVGVAMRVIGIAIYPTLKVIQATWIVAWNILKEVIGPIWDFISGIITGALKAIHGTIMFFVNLINGDWGAAWDSLKEVFAGFWDILYQLTVGAGKILWHAVEGLLKGIVDVFDGIWDKMWDIGKNIVKGLVDGLESAVSAVWNFIMYLPRKFLDTIKSLFGIHSPSSEMAEIGLNIIQGLLDGLISMIEKLWSWVGQLPTKFLNFFSDAASWLRDIGKMILEGLLDGLKDGWDAVSGWLGDVGGWIVDLKGPPEKDATLLTQNGWLIMYGLQMGMSGYWSETIQPWLASLGPDIEGAIKDVIDRIPVDQMMSATAHAINGSLSDLTAETQAGLVAAIAANQMADPINITFKADGTQEVHEWVYRIGSDLVTVNSETVDAIRNSLALQETIAGIDKERGVLRLAQDFDDVKGRIQQAFDDAASGAKTAEQVSRDYQGALLDIKEEVIKYGTEIAKLPAEQISKVVALIDQGKLDEAEALLAAFASAPRTITFEARVNTPTPGSVPYLAAGGIITRPTFALVGEAGNELVLPLGDATRSMQLIRQAGVQRWFATESNAAGKLTAARGATVSGSGTVNNKQVVINGDLSFPNITKADDAEQFISNLEALAGAA